MHLESLIDQLGGFGIYQITLNIILFFVLMASVPSMLVMGFGGYEPDWWCTAKEQDYFLSNLTFTNNTYKNCNWNGTCVRRFSDSMETIVSQWDLVCDLNWVSNTITSIQMGGLLTGGLLTGYIADSYGRKKTCYGGVFILCVANAVTAFSVSWIMFAIMRFIIGIAAALVFSTVYLYQIEFVGKKWRMFITAIPDWPMGVILNSLLCKWIHHWKWLHVAFAVLLASFIPTYLVTDESLRFLAVKGHLHEANRVVKKMATMNRKPVPDTSILELIAEEEKAKRDKAKNYTYLDLFKTRDLTKKTLLTCFSWCSYSCVYYGIFFGVKNLSGDLFFNMLLMALTELPLFIFVILFTARCGRRHANMSGLLLTSAACFGVAVCTRYAPVKYRDTYVSVLASAAKCLMMLSWVIMQALAAEQYPTVIRNQAYAAHNTSARIGGILSAQVFALSGTDDLMVPYLAMGGLALVSILICLPLGETRDRPLEDTMKKADTEITIQGRELKPLNGKESERCAVEST